MRTPHALLAAVLLLGTSACRNDEAATTDDTLAVDSSAMMNDDAMATGPADTTQTIESTASLLEGGVASIAPSAALPIIDGWIARLENAQFDEARELREGLRELRTELSASPIDGKGVGETLHDLGEQTLAVAAGADAAQQAGLRQLGNALQRAGTALGATDIGGTPAADDNANAGDREPTNNN